MFRWFLLIIIMVKDLGRGGGRGRGAWEVEERGVVEGEIMGG